MNNRQIKGTCKLIILFLMLASLLATSIGCAVYPLPRRKIERVKLVYVHEPPPALIAERRPRKPNPKAVWVGGHWRWAGRKYVWVRGHWERNPRGAWISGRWERRPDGWVWVAGRWRKFNNQGG
ncbi:MAG: YXWGXW repeat-containing protein [Candidatus Poribacteria bacterium]|nr:YXWGXW repeat-containing protein [Candidatus Poribacteria bacterium]MDE0503585.1 YXWGXW repeat-containing protein [Candidatus Poribacteria bacterium]